MKMKSMYWASTSIINTKGENASRMIHRVEEDKKCRSHGERKKKKRRLAVLMKADHASVELRVPHSHLWRIPWQPHESEKQRIKADRITQGEQWDDDYGNEEKNVSGMMVMVVAQ